MKKPAKYKYPLRSRAAILEWLKARKPYFGHYEFYPLNWNVKAYGVNLDFDHLVKRFQEWASPDIAPGGKYHEAYLAYARKKHAQLRDDELWQWGTEEAWRSVENDDGRRMLWNDEGPQVDIEFGLEGRSGGHLVVRKYDGFTFGRGRERYEWEQYLDELTWKDLWYLYRMVVTWDADFTQEAARDEIEYQAAFQFFVNHVGDESWIDESKVFRSAAIDLGAPTEEEESDEKA